MRFGEVTWLQDLMSAISRWIHIVVLSERNGLVLALVLLDPNSMWRWFETRFKPNVYRWTSCQPNWGHTQWHEDGNRSAEVRHRQKTRSCVKKHLTAWEEKMLPQVTCWHLHRYHSNLYRWTDATNQVWTLVNDSVSVELDLPMNKVYFQYIDNKVYDSHQQLLLILSKFMTQIRTF